MFQSFEVKGGPALGKRNLPKLRKTLRATGLDGFIIPHEDEYQNEYLPDANERLAWATGFTGSAGMAVVLRERAAIFVDGRYTVQAEEQTDPDLFERASLENTGPTDWLREAVQPGQDIGYDPKLHSPTQLKTITEVITQMGAHLVAVDTNPIDQAWADRPAQPCAPITPHPIAHAGRSHAEKITGLADHLANARMDAALLTDPTSIAWLLNIRGGDVAHTPLALATALISRAGEVTLFVHPDKLTPAVREHLGEGVRIEAEGQIKDALAALAGYRVLVDPKRTSAWYFDQLDRAGAIVSQGADPCAIPKACKNAAELSGAQAAHERDATAIVRFLHWLETNAPDGEVTEITAAQHLETLRKQHAGDLQDLSFETISAFGPNGALPHYRVNTRTNRKLKRGSLYLVDSGGQFTDGTTDITRTIAIGRPKKEMRERFTLVLKGHIAMATIRFPAGTTGGQIDVLARAHLWQSGFDYDHGTGHGVGSYLGVHEGPGRIAKIGSDAPLLPGMIMSNEPGYYKPGEGGYGIRIENLQVITAAKPIEGGERDMLGFTPLTLAPIDRTLIVRSMLTKTERAWVDDYHATVLDIVGPMVEPDIRNWLETACAALGTGTTASQEAEPVE